MIREETTFPEIDSRLCTGCEACVEACALDALTIANSRAVVVDPEECTYCGDCEEACPVGAIACPFDIVDDEGRT